MAVHTSNDVVEEFILTRRVCQRLTTVAGRHFVDLQLLLAVLQSLLGGVVFSLVARELGGGQEVLDGSSDRGRRDVMPTGL